MNLFSKRVAGYLLFEQPLTNTWIDQEFISLHTTQLEQNEAWTTKVTRLKMIFLFWSKYVTSHWAAVFFISVLIILPAYPNLFYTFLLPSIIVNGITLAILTLFIYLPLFVNEFLPALENIRKKYEQAQHDNKEKCRKGQLSNLSLCLVFYILDKLCNEGKLQPNDQYAALLTQLSGVDQGSLNKNLELIYPDKTKRNQWTGRKRTEIRNRFQEAYNFFESLTLYNATPLLYALEQKILAPAKNNTTSLQYLFIKSSGDRVITSQW